ncbi:MAG TPA: hypothetical protein VFF43_16950, partial [Caldimonas sp.]|nr:hypothetical protein [Caldimonas sp.]
SWTDHANSKPTLIERLRALLRADNYISFAELDQLDGFCGDQTLTLDGYPNLVVWTGISRQAVDDLATLLERGECRLGLASPFTYLIDGKALNLPIAKRLIHYKKPRWLRVVLLRA